MTPAHGEPSDLSFPNAVGLNQTEPKICAVCKREANCYNFGVMSCDACKMFFKRTMTLNVRYVCRRNHRCFDENFSCFDPPYCRACRLIRCINVGMRLHLSTILEVKNRKDDAIVSLIENLLHLDARREKQLLKCFTHDNPTLEDIIECRKLSIVARDPTFEMTSSDWCFFGTFTAVQFLLQLGFMRKMDTRDKAILLANYSAKATLLFSAIRTMRAKKDNLIKPDGKDFFGEFLSKWSDFSVIFTNRVRSMLVCRLIELKITNEELVLIAVIFFCNPVLDELSQDAVRILTEQQKTYSSALMQYCLLTYQQNGPARFTELLSLCTVINQYFDDVQYLYWIFQYHFHVQYKNLVARVI